MDLKKCLYCGKIIPMNSLSISDYNRKKFCNNSCAASYNNRLRGKKKNYCLMCGKEIPLQNKFCSCKCHKDFEYVFVHNYTDSAIDLCLPDYIEILSGNYNGTISVYTAISFQRTPESYDNHAPQTKLAGCPVSW